MNWGWAIVIGLCVIGAVCIWLDHRDAKRSTRPIERNYLAEMAEEDSTGGYLVDDGIPPVPEPDTEDLKAVEERFIDSYEQSRTASGAVLVETLRCSADRCHSSISVKAKDHADALNQAHNQGWSTWFGTTMGGEEKEVLYCHDHNPSVPFMCVKHDGVWGEDPECGDCFGKPVPEIKRDEGWRAECYTCGDAYSEEWDKEGFGQEKGAWAWADDHVCNTYVKVIDPSGKNV